MNKSVVLGIFRHVLNSSAVAVAVQGFMTGDELQAAAGALTTLLAVGLSIWDKKKAK